MRISDWSSDVCSSDLGWREDARRVRIIREAVGDDIDLMIDANYLFNPVEAKYLCRAIEDCNLTWFEEPLQQNDARALADLRRSTRIPLAEIGRASGRERVCQYV